MRPAEFNGTRSKVVDSAKGIVLEVGFGSGYNLPLYKNVQKLYALDPSKELFAYAADRIAAVQFPVEYLPNSAEYIPLQDNSIDTVVSTWSLCSIPNIEKALNEIRRVLIPGGRFLFVEHGQSPKKINSIVQQLVTPIFRHFNGNCHLDRKIDDYIQNRA
jgi:ubiquinone/menaquinone biosynthesis C-methylase UbiE